MKREHYAILTKRFTLRTSHDGWLKTTRHLYNEILGFYYALFLEHEELHHLNTQGALRGLEQLTIVGRDKMPVPEPLPWKKVPLYFRRAVINDAIAAGRSYLGRMDGSKGQDAPTHTFASSVTFYKGMYRDLCSNSVSLKVYNGEAWHWLHCRLSGNTLDEDAEWMSPKLVFSEKHTELHIPEKHYVADGRKLKERLGEDLRICSLQFMNQDAFVLCCAMDDGEHVYGVRFIRGGQRYKNLCSELLNRIDDSAISIGAAGSRDFGSTKTPENFNKKYWNKLHRLSQECAHQASHQIIEFCKEKNVSIILLPKYSPKYTRYIMASVGKWSPLRLSRRIIEQLGYKAWKAGILVVHVEASDIGRCCVRCGGEIRKQGDEFSCACGLKGNRHVNAARNLGKKFMKNMKKDSR